MAISEAKPGTKRERFLDWIRNGSPDIATRGGINCELIYDSDLDALRRQTQHVLNLVVGSKHAIGDTNLLYPFYPWENIQAVIDIVRKSGSLFA